MSTDNISGQNSGTSRLPDLESQEALVYCGFANHAATIIFNNWNQPDIRQHWDFFRFAIRSLRSRTTDDCGGTLDDWDDYLRKCGANTQIRAALTRLGWDDVRLTQTALFWFIWSLESKYMYLEYLKALSDEHEQEIREEQHDQAGSISADASADAPADLLADTWPDTSADTRPDTSQDTRPDTSQDTRPDTSQDTRPDTSQDTSDATARGSAPGRTVLWKACDRIRVEKKCWTKPNRQGEFRFDGLESERGGDFNPRMPTYYFTSSIAGAKRYAKWARTILSHAGVCLVRIELPNEAIENARPYRLQYPSDEFKKAVWYGRKLESYTGILDAVKQAHFVIGDTSRGTAQAIARLGHWSDIDEGNLVKVLKDETKVHDGPEDRADLTPEDIKKKYENVKQHVFDEDFWLGLSDADKQITVHSADDHTVVFTEGIDWRIWEAFRQV